RKKQVTAMDLEALVTDDLRTIGVSGFELVAFDVHSASESEPTSTVTITLPDGAERSGTGTGDGTVDSVFAAINVAAGVEARLREYRVDAVSEGQDALGHVSVVVELGEVGDALALAPAGRDRGRPHDRPGHGGRHRRDHRVGAGLPPRTRGRVAGSGGARRRRGGRRADALSAQEVAVTGPRPGATAASGRGHGRSRTARLRAHYRPRNAAVLPAATGLRSAVRSTSVEPAEQEPRMSHQLDLDRIDASGDLRTAAHDAGALVDEPLGRRAALRRGALAAAGAAAGAGLFQAMLSPAEAAIVKGKRSKGNDVAILNYALTLEFLESAFYAQANANIRFADPNLAFFAQTTGAHEAEHVKALQSVLGSKAISSPNFNFGAAVTDEATFAKTAVVLEDTGVAAYAGQGTNIFGAAVLKAALSIHSVEARHAAWIRALTGGLAAQDASAAARERRAGAVGLRRGADREADAARRHRHQLHRRVAAERNSDDQLLHSRPDRRWRRRARSRRGRRGHADRTSRAAASRRARRRRCRRCQRLLRQHPVAAEAAIVPGRRSAANDIAVLKYALLLEHLESAFYLQATKNITFSTPEIRFFARVVASHEKNHVDTLSTALGRKAFAPPPFDFGTAVKDEKTFLATSQILEDTGVAAYAGQGGNLSAKANVVAALSIHSVEARHAAWVRYLNGGFAPGSGDKSPAPAAFDTALSESQVVAAVQSTKFVPSLG
ncbi:MAG: ferritin-like domain-containing protein, partial [Patulibacter minatonensis]